MTTTRVSAYVPAPPPTDPQQLPRYLQEEFAKISHAFQAMLNYPLQMRYAAPKKPQPGLYLFDGTSYNPGSGRGVYWYDSTSATYKFLG